MQLRHQDKCPSDSVPCRGGTAFEDYCGCSLVGRRNILFGNCLVLEDDGLVVGHRDAVVIIKLSGLNTFRWRGEEISYAPWPLPVPVWTSNLEVRHSVVASYYNGCRFIHGYILNHSLKRALRI